MLYEHQIKLITIEPKLCTDNAAMIGLAATHLGNIYNIKQDHITAKNPAFHMKLKFNLSQTQNTKQRLSPKLINALKFHATYNQIVDQIQVAQNENMFIEITQSDQLSTRNSSSLPTNNDISDFTADQSFPSLNSFLLNQINYVRLSPVKKVIEKLIEGLNDNGYFKNFKELNNLF